MSKNFYEKWKNSGELENILILVRKWRRDGAEINEIADKLGVSRTTIFKYQNDYSDFADALKKGKEVCDTEVENSLIKECIGYMYEETTTTTSAIVDKSTGQITSLERVETKTTKRYARPSTSAIAYYLNNRASNKWQNRVFVVSEADQSTIDEVEAMVMNSDQSESD